MCATSFPAEAIKPWIVGYAPIDVPLKEVSRTDRKKAQEEYERLEEISKRIGFDNTVDQNLITFFHAVTDL
ncbi:hypothetical protein [Pelagicoccus sp. SDUM812002]|uniref:hypothetical protein n=1 Tax=Pelagicoccus sp. SDUM812002 TaxID=3041266 RepID=UPI002811AB3C|nr:hypothetical protein [Pelagicoccus sp. SDUM812002]